MSEAWEPLTMRAVRIVSAAAAGGIRTRGESFEYLVRDATGEGPDIAVRIADDLLELVPALRPASIALECADAERPALLALVATIRQDRRVIEAQH